MLTKRQILVIKVLMEQSTFMTLRQISKICSISEKTVQSELLQIQDVLLDKQFAKLHKVRGKGIFLELNQHTMLEFNKLLTVHKDNELNFLMRRLFFSHSSKVWTEKTLSEQLCLPRGQFHKKLIELSTFCKQYDVEIKNKQNYGITIQGSEFQIRDSIIALFMAQSDYPFEKTGMGMILDQNQSDRFQQIFPGLLKRPLETMILKLEQRNHIYLDHISRINIFLHMCLSVIRTQYHYEVSLSQEQLALIPIKSNEDDLRAIYHEIEQAYHISLPYHEKCYIQLYLDSYGFLSEGGFEGAKNKIRSSSLFQNFLHQFINVLNTILNIDINNETTTLHGLIAHVSGTIIRLKNGIRIHNPLLAEVKKSFSSIYQATWSTSILFDQYFHITITEDEIAYIALYLGVVREKTNYHLHLCLVCPRINNLTMILKEQVLKLHHAIRLDALLTPQDYEALRDLHSWDLVITTLDELDIDTSIHVNAIMSNDEKAYLQSVINHIADKKILRNESFSLVNEHSLFDERLIFIKSFITSKEELITLICEKLLQYDYTSNDFLPSVLKREREISTEIGAGVAIPHGNALYVKRTVIVYVSLAQPIEWVPKESVRHIFLPVINSTNKKEVEDSIKKFYKTLISLIERGEIDSLLDMDAPNEIMKAIENGLECK